MAMTAQDRSQAGAPGPQGGPDSSNASKKGADPGALLPARGAVEAVLSRRVQEVPSLPVVALKLLRLIRDEDTTATDLTRVVSTDPALTARVLKIVNSAAYGLPHRVSSINQAIVILGFSAIRTLALGVAVFRMVRPNRKGGFDQVLFWEHCLAVAGLAMALAEEVGYPNPEEAYVAGLLHDIGKLILDVYGRIGYGELVEGAARSDGLLVEDERKIIGLGHDDLGAWMCHDWGLPDSLILAIKLHHQRFDRLGLSHDQALLVAVVAVANFLAWTQGLGSVSVLRHPVLQPEVEALVDLDRIDLGALVTRMDREVQSTTEFYNFSFPSSAQLRENLLRANIELSRLNTRYYYLHEQQEVRLESLTRLKEQVFAAHRSLNPQEILTSTLDAIQDEFRLDRVYALRVDRSRRVLVTQAARDATALGLDLSNLEVELTPDAGGFLTCLREQQPLLVVGETAGERQVLDFLQVETLGLVPFCHNGQAIGVVAMDNVFSGRPIAPSDLAAVAIVASELGTALENARLFAEVREKAYTDPLTQLANRARLDTLLGEALAEAAGGAPLSLAMVDVDHFKRFNDVFGHLAGDSILKLVAGTISKFSRNNTEVGRFGGEEFLVILHAADLAGARRYGERIRGEVERLGALLIKRFPRCPLTVSVGVATYDAGIRTKDDLIARADEALYRAKAAGRNRVVAYGGAEASA
jgi:two-component system cell cycle response regulator